MSLDFTLTLGYTVGKTTLIFPGLNGKVGMFGLWKFNMTIFLRIGLYALLGFLLANSGITLRSSFGDFVSIMLVVLIIDIIASRNHER